MPLVTDLKDIINEMKTLLGLATQFDNKMSDAGKSLTKASKGMNANGGQRNNGKNSSSVMGDSLADFGGSGTGGSSNSNGGHDGGNAFAKIQQMEMQRLRVNTGLSMMGRVAAAGVGAVAGMARMMPDTSSVLGYAQGYYSAGINTGGFGRRSVEVRTLNAMRGGLTQVGGDAVTAATLTGMGVMVGSSPNSQYMTDVRGVANAAKYLGMDNGTAAQALAGLNSGPTSAMLLRSMGVRTSDWRTGKTLNQGQIFSQIAGRLTAGQPKATLQQTMDSIQRGKLGASIAGSGLDPAQQEMLKKYMLARSMGFKMNLSDNGAMNKLNAFMAKKGNENPALAAMNINTTSTGVMQAGESSYIAGAQGAAQALNALEDAAKKLAATFGGLQSFGSIFGGNNIGQGAATIAGSVGGAALGFGSDLLKYKLLSNIIGGGSKGGGMAGSTGAKGGKPPGAVWKAGGKGGGGQWVVPGKSPKVGNKIGGAFKKFGGLKGTSALKGTAGLGGILTGISVIGDLMNGDMRGAAGDIGGFLGGVGAVAGLGLVTEGVGLLGSTAAYAGGSMVGTGIGTGLYDLIAGGGTGGEQSLVGTGSTTATADVLSGGFGGGALGSTQGQRSVKTASQTNFTQWGKKKGIAKGPSATHSGLAIGSPLHGKDVINSGGEFADRTGLHGTNGHSGVDLRASTGTKVYAAASGHAEFKDSGNSGLGKHIMIYSPNKKHAQIKITYGHLDSVSPNVVGKMVKKGQQIGISGHSGSTSGGDGSHLHFMMEKIDKGKTKGLIDPTSFVEGNAGSGKDAFTGFYNPTEWSKDKSNNVYGGHPWELKSKLNSSKGGGPYVAAPKSGSGGTGSGNSAAAASTNSGSTTSSGGKTIWDALGALFGVNSNSGALSFGFNNATSGSANVVDLLASGASASLTSMFQGGSHMPGYRASAPSASKGMEYVVNDGPVNVHRGETILDVSKAREYRQEMAVGKKGSGNNVTINVHIKEASASEAKKFAQKIKTYLEEDKMMTNMGAF